MNLASFAVLKAEGEPESREPGRVRSPPFLPAAGGGAGVSRTASQTSTPDAAREGGANVRLQPRKPRPGPNSTGQAGLLTKRIWVLMST